MRRHLPGHRWRAGPERDQRRLSYINYPDVDLADPAYNKSGVPWHDLYYLGNYPRLQQIKAKWDPPTPSTTSCRSNRSSHQPG
ncbi:BBE domain-containing protein [Kribbella steppae]|uniref:BBE domain-containing protein n=1 Tax=Kribbella steppae TaxID=2512223 RepID=UPI001F542BB0|nr:BBE domain-containing protein [Kribbella steppae]